MSLKSKLKPHTSSIVVKELMEGAKGLGRLVAFVAAGCGGGREMRCKTATDCLHGPAAREQIDKTDQGCNFLPKTGGTTSSPLPSSHVPLHSLPSILSP